MRRHTHLVQHEEIVGPVTIRSVIAEWMAAYRERRLAEREAGIVIDDEGRITGEAA